MTKKNLSLAVCLFLQSVSSYSIQVVHPTDLISDFSSIFDGNIKSGFLDTSLGNFGHFDYGTTIKGRVNYPLTNTDGCEPFKTDDFEFDIINTEKYNNRGHTPIIMVDRGNCHFVKKAQNAQKYGAAMLLVIDNNASESPSSLVMADDGMGSSVRIPSFIIKKSDGEKLKAAVKQWVHSKSKKDDSASQKKVVIQADITLAQKSIGQIEVDLWYTGAHEFLKAGWNFGELAEMQDIFTRRVEFEPRTIITRCGNSCSKETKNSLCVNDGRYCPVYPNNIQNLDNGDSLPENLIAQSIREQCVYQALGPKQKSHWFKYMDSVIRGCLIKNRDTETDAIKPISEECHDSVLAQLFQSQKSSFSIDNERLTACITTQSELVGSSKSYNTFFDEDLEVEKTVGSIFHPSMSINNHTFRGDYSNSNNLFKSICSVMLNRPDICSTFSLVDDSPMYRDNMEHRNQTDQDERVKRMTDKRYEEFDQSLTGMSKRARGAEIILGLTIVCIINCSCLIFCKMYNKKENDSEMQAQVNEQVSEYFALAANDDTERSTSGVGGGYNN